MRRLIPSAAGTTPSLAVERMVTVRRPIPSPPYSRQMVRHITFDFEYSFLIRHSS